MKKPVAAVVLLVGAWWAAAAYTSHEVPKRRQAQIELLQKRFSGAYLTDVTETSGLTSGTYSARVHLGCQPGTPAYRPDADVAFGIEQHVQYGPFPGFKRFGAAHTETRLVLPDDLPAPLDKLAAVVRTIELTSDYAYSGADRGLIRLPSGELSVDSPTGPVKVHWAEARLDASGTSDLSSTSVRFAWPELKAEGAAGHVLISNMSGAQDTTGAGLLWNRPGHVEFGIDRIEVGGPNMQFSMDKFQGKGDTTRTDFVDIAGGYTIAAIDAQVGREFKLKNFEFGFSAKHWQAVAADQLMEQLSRFSQAQCMIKPDPTGDPREATMERFKPLLAAMQALAAQDPSISIDKLGFELEGQRGEVSGGLALKGYKAPASSEDFAAIHAALMQAATAQGQATLPMAWLALMGGPERAEQTAQGLTAPGFFVRDGDKLKSAFSLAQGKATLNGNPMPLPGQVAGADETPQPAPEAALPAPSGDKRVQ